MEDKTPMIGEAPQEGVAVEPTDNYEIPQEVLEQLGTGEKTNEYYEGKEEVQS